MAYYRDLDRCDYFPCTQFVPLIAIGWLEGDHDFTRGAVDAAFLSKLQSLAKDPWGFLMCMGIHVCTRCNSDQQAGLHNLFIPHKGKIYTAPELIIHYIADHEYRPPDVFIEAVMACPEMNTQAYMQAIRANGGKTLVGPLQG